MKLRLWVAGLTLVTGTAFAQATQWLLISGTENAREYIDQATITRNGNFVKVWVMGDLDSARPFKGKTFRSLKGLWEFDCIGRRARLTHASLYAGQMGAGDLIDSDYVNDTWKPAVPQSVGETKLKFACNWK